MMMLPAISAAERLLAVRAGALYGPVLIAFVAAYARHRRPRQFAAVLLSLLWMLPALLVLQRLNQHFAWWTFTAEPYSLRGMPLELYLGWVVLWGAVPQLVMPRLNVWAVTAIMLLADALLMPLCAPAVLLGRAWLAGEAIAVLLVLLPALLIARWTELHRHLPWRAAMQVLTAGGLFLFLVPELVFALRPGAGWSPLLNMPSMWRQLGLEAVFLLALPGLGAVMEFAKRGGGTPIPYDPPVRLVTSGMYRFCPNPMQLSCALVLLVWALLLRNGWLLGSVVFCVVYSAGLAEWDEAEDLRARFGPDWVAYRKGLRLWWFRWRPYVAGPPARLYLADGCLPCGQVRDWLQARRPVGLELHAAQELPVGTIRRMRYVAADGSVEEGVRAMGRALEHLNFGWAVAGTLLRLPLVWQAVQMLLDVSGLGPREPVRGCELTSHSSQNAR